MPNYVIEKLCTKFLGSSVVKDHFIRWTETNASHDISYLGCVNQSISTVPEIEQVKDLSYICVQTNNSRFKSAYYEL